MGIEQDLVEFLENRIKDGPNKLRDIEIIKFYYGKRGGSMTAIDIYKYL